VQALDLSSGFGDFIGVSCWLCSWDGCVDDMVLRMTSVNFKYYGNISTIIGDDNFES
jgi:hypothetical protein